MSDRIALHGIAARGFHGVLAEEKAVGQPFSADVVLEVDTARAGASDDLSHTVNYAEVAAVAHGILAGPSLDLVETVANRIAEASLRHTVVEAVEVTVHKPQAPVGVPFDDVTVSVRRERDVPVVVALGANLGLPAETLASAVREVDALDGVTVQRASPLVETDPVGGPEQPTYLNAVLVARTRLSPWHLLRELHAVEARHGRRREVRWGARTLDLDLVQYGDPRAGGDVVLDDPELTLPHPRAHERAFVLVPWSEVDPAARLRVGADVADVPGLAARLDSGGVRPGPPWPAPWWGSAPAGERSR
ncbi:MAG TPA: 2-amino-4-hydroxy-6-hydroxymethyldihydropteridine diphosphokinase [Segeticoccus sp.]|uniref:2-amino-4-hydroxy-6- hydroxymethyldihydropteridine diphosphokinase n=1 Tax=Segeticoccus sp. TaxID=2706531 RepID=UPI002D7F7D0C|nr:2-amino-4-hydroxy-6-hydroxymethyldihydropteridine diphosphokinase [Segeticoccus sp.]HET8599053.1 2-amino-4-hydroxy-6-hydroxymethyldihydropteridine diphosphokinase [Segeticoccus sp.]